MPEIIDYKTFVKASDFHKFNIGETKIRIVSPGLIVKKHEMKAGVFTSIPCDETTTCKSCVSGAVPKVKFTWIVLDRTNNLCRVLESGSGLGSSIATLARENGDPRMYDIIVTAVGQNLTRRYTIKMGNKDELTQEEKDVIESNYKYLYNKHLEQQVKNVKKEVKSVKNDIGLFVEYPDKESK